MTPRKKKDAEEEQFIALDGKKHTLKTLKANSPSELDKFMNPPQPEKVKDYSKIYELGGYLVVRIPGSVRSKFNVQKGQFVKFSYRNVDKYIGNLIIQIVSAENVKASEYELQKIRQKDIRSDTFARKIIQAMLDEGGQDCWFTTKKVADITGLDWKTVRKYLEDLAEREYIVKRQSRQLRQFDDKEVASSIEWKVNVPRLNEK